MLLRLARLHLSPEQLAKPIPSLTQRQFIVSKKNESASDERMKREMFWYREELLKRISASWNEVRSFLFSEQSDRLIVVIAQVGSLRTGSISLRGLRLTRPLLEILRSDEVEIELSLDDNPSANPGVFSKRGSADRLLYSTRANDFMDVCARIVNNSGPFSFSSLSLLTADGLMVANTLHLLLRLELLPHDVDTTPTALAHLSRYVVVDGLSSVPLPVLAPGASTTARISLCLMAEGRYEFGCFVEELTTELEEKESRGYRARIPMVLEVDC